jgi:hypothetical protein
MNIPRFWSRADGRAEAPGGKPLSLMSWGWSSAGIDDAKAAAARRLEQMVRRVREGRPFPDAYDYGARPIREEIVGEIEAGGEPAAVVTRNRYGCLVLNAASVLFLDVDLPEPKAAPLGGLFRWLRGRRGDPETDSLARLRDALAAGAGASFRIYRTAAGFRAIALDREFEPGSPQVDALMAASGADPAFAQLCRSQRSFRARLTPKPWRCGVPLPPGAFPRESADLEASFREWLSHYEDASRAHATCRLVEERGGAPANPRIAAVLALHDHTTRAAESLPLA